MDKYHGSDPLFEVTNQIAEAVLGPDDDFLDRQCCEEFLLASGIDSATLVSDFREHLQERARHFQSSNGSVPNRLASAIRVIRERLKSLNDMSVDPASHIDLVINGGQLTGRYNQVFAPLFRRDTDAELCDEDQKLLDELEAELAEDDPAPSNEPKSK
jgi:hypothetical protein